MDWLGNLTNDSAVLRNILGLDAKPNKVLEVKPEQYENRTVLSRQGKIYLYGPDNQRKEKYEIVLVGSCTKNPDQLYSIFRSNTLEPAEKLFSVFKDKVPVLVQISKDLCSTSGIGKLCDLLTNHPTWTLAHLAAHLSLYDAFVYAAVNSHVNTSDQTSGVSPLQIAIQANNLKMVQLLLAAKSSLDHLDHNANTVYHYAVHASAEIIMALGPSAQNSLNARNSSGHTPLHVACHANKPESVKALLLIGADVNIPPVESKPTTPGYVGDFLREKPDALNSDEMKYGGTPLHWSTSKETINALIEQNCDVDVVNFDGRTALHIMVMKKKLECVVALLTRMASVDIVDKDGNTPLHHAVVHAVPVIVQALIGFGADVNIANHKGETPRHLVQINDNADRKKILYMLHAVGARRCPPEMEGCHIGCNHNENFNGEAPPEVSSAASRAVLDQVLSTASAKKQASEGKRKLDGGRLLCLDGGGIRGLVLVQILLEIESVIKKPIVECFDWIAGTSTGGILALGLAVGKSLKECVAIYFDVKDKAFVGNRPYDSEGLETILKNAVGTETVMAQIKNPKLMITGVLADRMPVDLHLFRNYESPNTLLGVPPSGKFMETLPPERQLVWRAARATGAAPSYFRAFGKFLDGGLIANNPTLDALTEINEYNLALEAVGRTDEVKPISLVVSLGTGLIPVRKLENIDVFIPESLWDTPKVAKGLSALGTLLVDQATASDGRLVDRAKSWCSMIGVPYFRFNPQMSEEISMDEKSDEKIVQMMWDVKAFMYAHQDEVKKLAAILEDQ
ncbi:85/88 kDa calcium-independent phospholipase A2-like [Neodiprion fabricii]|uniref:85/88 kDa calcium-independent phospholipase A2-like n=1 Tax=Neodiprion fabricii TaxID=2872261 RepID=UPI001ED926E9|nr:85/88 kDa calcium-independent phospholipase A2-like [Neodiprion fabricii]XP_046424778.1 85/88 kDa calcium-independent phospholipase A2-like [Neodiprion fabricii]XP_046424779.1 85/88 kDa calcium-independent phospholipase A2-like [Neodiprion fabricii]XP_046424780.1 85/88 kDa calcium-independent phospholipase A2-like [Neodiprion fabricii]